MGKFAIAVCQSHTRLRSIENQVHHIFEKFEKETKQQLLFEDIFNFRIGNETDDVVLSDIDKKKITSLKWRVIIECLNDKYWKNTDLNTPGIYERVCEEVSNTYIILGENQCR